ncbi:response regulator [Paenibacillus lutrae]|uniref:Response regulator n=1 Tax=Paenibacillus lutrae TaxID=2078573 RepID=A0A7X3FMA1_9BACL|nr:response regulator [Paenibacillus lutrae]MVP02353.1 response regulator [Paenibacillus lutrae]
MTLKVMLVDDELLVRLGIKSLIEWEQHGFTYLGDAPDGEKALELMQHEPPDILLTDIVMPRMNGLELIDRVKLLYPDMLIIVLSSHNEFDYVRKAMKLGVEDYILKTSLKPSELLDILVETSKKIARKREQPAIGSNREGRAISREEAAGRKLSLWLARCAGQTAAPQEPSEPEEELPPGSFFLLLQPQQLREGVPEASAMQMLSHLFQSELGELLACPPLGTGHKHEMILLIRGGADQKTPDAALLAANLASSSNRLLGITLNVALSGVLGSWHEFSRAYAQAREEISNHQVLETSRDDIKRLLDYMKENYAQDISLKQAAEMINISESYLSYIFKKETGTGFTDCLNMLRIDKAAHSLLHTHLPIYEISLQVGYENINYFGRIFKKIKGVSPQKYRNQFK